MNNFILSEIKEIEKKFGSYQYLLTFRYANLCIKADAMSLMPVTVAVGATGMNIEEVAEVAELDDYHLGIKCSPKIRRASRRPQTCSTRSTEMPSTTSWICATRSSRRLKMPTRRIGFSLSTIRTIHLCNGSNDATFAPSNI